MKGVVRSLAALVALSAGIGPADAHHSFAMFDQEKVSNLQGTVREVQWVNPHCWIQLLVPTGGGTVEWSIEMTSPGILARQGWKPNTLKPGDKVAIDIHPLRTGQAGGSFVSILLPSGQRLGGDQIAAKKQAG